ncbi:hypothetical protein ACFY2Q_28870 [Micromonospora sp. NPDC000316]|uniref:hypothetical protein n=1 Tax=Micromonospora sp. NPDC000316 TaxID=3364216 RepID=UPI0036B53BD8
MSPLLVVLDPGAAWTLSAAGVDVPSLLVDLAGTYPPPTRNLLLRARRRIGHRTRGHDLVRRYQRTTGRRPAISSTAVAALIIG